jgi:hypothetical protein
MLFPWLTPEQRESHEASIWVMDATFPHNWSPEYRQKHTGIANFENAWSESTRQKILARWKEYGYGDI